MRKVSLVAASAFAVAFAFASVAQAQDAANGLSAGAKSLSFSIPSGGNGYAGNAAGLWMMMGPTMNLGINVGLSYASSDAASPYALLLAPAIRMYMDTSSSVAPFYFGQLNLLIANNDNGNDEDDAPEMSVAGGLGVEWFPVKAFSVSGHVGVGAKVLGQEGAPKTLGTFTSGLTAQMYF